MTFTSGKVGDILICYFICATPFHVINSIVIKENYFKNDKCFLFLQNHFANSEKIFEKLCLENDFECRFIDDSSERIVKKNRICNKVDVISKYCNINAINKYHISDEKPDVIVMFSFTYFNTLVLSDSYRNNKNVEIFIGEDGIRDYIYEDFGIKDERVFEYLKKLRNMIGYPLITIPDRYMRFLYQPDIREDSFDDKCVLPICKEGFNVITLKSKINRIFSFSEKKNITNRFIYFESIYGEQEMATQKRIVDCICGLNLGVTIKKHPRSKSIYEGADIYEYSDVSWEVICINCNIEDKVLLTINSNACFSPKYMFDKEPIVFFLYRLLFDNKTQQKNDRLVSMLRNKYRDRSKIFVPQNINEFMEQLQCLK